MIQVAYVICWWLALEAIGLVSFPLVSRVCSSLGDKGYSISKLVGVLALTYFVWLFSVLKLLPFGSTSIIIAFLLFAGLSLFLGRKNLKLAKWPWKQILISELIFAVFFVVFLLIVREKPDINFTGSSDGLFNTGFIQSILRGNYFPPPDPWFAGESIQYYYGEHVLVATFCWITKVPTTIAFNIAVAMFPALGVCAAYGLGYNITRRKTYGFLALIFIFLIGYISGAFQLIAFGLGHKFLGYTPSGFIHNIGDWFLGFDFFNAHWLIDGSIVHYPYSAFLMGDLHSYSVSPVFQVTFIMLVFALFQKGSLRGKNVWTDTLVDIVVLSLCLGFFFILNTWEYPTYIIFTILAFILLRIGSTLKGMIGIPLAIICLSFLLYLPYYLAGGMNGFQGLGIVVTRTKLAHFAEFGALFLFVIIYLLLILSKQEIFRSFKKTSIAVLILLATILAAIFLHIQMLIIVVPIGLLSLYYIFKSKGKSEKEFVLLLLLMGVALVFFCELFHLHEPMGKPWERLNTVMKIYFQIWVFLGAAAACSVFYVVSNLGRKTKAIWIFILALFIIASAIHPIASTTARLGGKYTDWGINKGGTLDGMAHLETLDKGDYEAIRWINREIKGSPVMLELAWTESDRWDRVSSFTGLPTILGSNLYELYWGRSREELVERERDVATIYNTLDNSEAMGVLKKYNVRYIYIGAQEKKEYLSDGLQKFAAYPENYTVAYENEGVVIYEVKE